MTRARAVPAAGFVIALLLLPGPSAAQGTIADYQRAMGLRDKYQNLALGTTDQPRFIEKTNRFHYRRTVKGGSEFVVVDVATREKKPAFDHEKLAHALSSALNRKVT